MKTKPTKKAAAKAPAKKAPAVKKAASPAPAQGGTVKTTASGQKYLQRRVIA